MSEKELLDVNETLASIWATLEHLKNRWESDEQLALKISEFQNEIVRYQITLISEN